LFQKYTNRQKINRAYSVPCLIKRNLIYLTQCGGDFIASIIFGESKRKEYTISTLHYNWPMSAHVSQVFSTSSQDWKNLGFSEKVFRFGIGNEVFNKRLQ